MTIDEAIKHAEEVAEEHERHLKVYENMDEDRPLFREEENECKDCAEEHRQLAGWLKELKQLREQKHCEDAVSRKTVLNTLNRMDSVLDENRTVETYKELLIACYNDLPPVTPARKKGKWIFAKTVFDRYGWTVECPSCHKKWKTYDEIRFEKENKYCPNCGEKMESEE